jgi:hypothetical protein
MEQEAGYEEWLRPRQHLTLRDKRQNQPTDTAFSDAEYHGRDKEK